MSEGRVIYVAAHQRINHRVERESVGLTVNSTSAPDFHKIGVTDGVGKRIDNMNTGTPHKIELITTIESNQPGEVERILHEIYSWYNVTGEWFKLPNEVVSSLEELERLDWEDANELKKWCIATVKSFSNHYIGSFKK